MARAERLANLLLRLRRRIGIALRRKLAEHSEHVVKGPPEKVRRALCRHGPDGQRADEYLRDAVRQLNRDGPKQGEVAAFDLREAAMALINLGGPKPFGLDKRAEEVISRWRVLRGGAGSEERVDKAIAELEEALADPNEIRLENAVRTVARRKPMRGDTDLLSRFLANLKDANHGLHNRMTRAEAVELYERFIEVIAALFGPITERLEVIDALLAIERPSDQDVARLLSLFGDDRPLLYFFEKVEGAGWFVALAERPEIRPPREGGWPAGSYLFGLATSHPALVRDWLVVRAREELNQQQAGFLLRIANRLESPSADLIADLAQGSLAGVEVQIRVERYLSGLSDQQLTQRGMRRLVIETLKTSLTGERAARDRHIATKLIEVVRRAISIDDPRAWLQILVYRLRDVSATESEFALSALLPLDELRGDLRSHSTLELIAAAVRDAVDAAVRAGLENNDLVEVLEKLEEPVRARLVAYFLNGRGASTEKQAKAFLLRQIETNPRPSPEELSLLRTVFSHDDPGFAAAVLIALGPAPSKAEIETLPTDEPLPIDLRRSHSWLVAMPESHHGEWREPDRLLTENFWAASQDGVHIRVGPAQFSPADSPIELDVLAALEPIEAAEMIGGWEPPPGRSFFDPSPEGLANTLTELVEKETSRWLDADPVAVVTALRAPRYVAGYFSGLEKAADRINGGPMLQLVQAIGGIQTNAAEGFDAGDGDEDGFWASAAGQGIRLIRKLHERDLLAEAALDEAWTVTVAAVKDRGNGPGFDGDLMTQAINRPWTVALETAFLLVPRDETLDPRLLGLLDECLGLPRPSGELGRAVIGPRLPLLLHYAPDWFAANEARLIGDLAPEGLGEITFSMYLQWGRPYEPILEEQRERVIAALDGQQSESALNFLLHGLVWSTDGFDATALTTVLAERPALFAEAARWLASSLDHDSDDLGPAVALWRTALARNLPPDAYAGWGWFALNRVLDDQTWLDLTLQTVGRNEVNLAEPEEIAQRAEAMAPNGQVLHLVSQLLDADPNSWELDEIGTVGLRLLRAGFGDKALRDDLRERLLERGFHDAADID